MKTPLLALAVCMIVGVAAAAGKVPVNPILPLWEHVPDPEPHVFGDRLYIYGSHDAANAWDFCLGDYVGWSAPTNDLGNWRYEGVIFAKKDDPENVTGNDALYAPDVARGPDGRYYLFYQRDNTSAQTDGAAHLGVAVCDRPAGRYRHLGYVRRTDGSLFGDHAGDNGFDPSVLVDDDGRIYLYVGVGSKGAHAYELKPDMLTIAQEFGRVIPGRGKCQGTDFAGHGFVEASSVRKIDGEYVFVYSAEVQPQLCYATAPTPHGPFAYQGVLNRSSCGNHGGLVKLGNNWFITRQRNTNGTVFSRQCCAEKIERTSDGKFLEAPCTSQGFSEGPLPARGDYPAGITFDGGHLVQQLGEGETADVFVAGLRKGTTVGFRTFDCRGVKRMRVEMRGWAQGHVEVRLDKPDGPLAGKIPTRRTNVWKFFEGDVKVPDGVHAIYLVFNCNCLCGHPQVRAFGFEDEPAVPAFDLAIPGSGYDADKPDCGMSAAQVFDALEASRVGTLDFRSSVSLPETSCTSVGFEGLDRKLFDPTEDVYARLAACGVKRARVQTMWSRCETRKGVYDFAALDEVVSNLTVRGIRPWFSVTFGNTLYMRGCRTAAAVGNVPLYYGDECRAAWLAYVRALARRSRGRVQEWEIWNEPNCSNFWQPRGANAKDYVELVKITGEAIRSQIPDAKIGGTTASGFLLDWERTFFECGGAKFIDFWSFHAYGVLPEGILRDGVVRDFVDEQREARSFIDAHGGGHVRIWQGESGFPSWFHKGHWLFPKGVCQEGWQSQANQAKWLLRRFATDRRAGIDVSSFYQACDIVRRYSMAVTTRPHPAEHGLLNGWTHEPKMSYRAMGNYNALLADATYDAAMKVSVGPSADAGVRTVAAGFRTAEGAAAFLYYAPFDFSGSYTGNVYRARADATLTMPKTLAPSQPVLVDLLRGGVYEVKNVTARGDEVEYAGLPLVDYPVVLTERRAVPTAAGSPSPSARAN